MKSLLHISCLVLLAIGQASAAPGVLPRVATRAPLSGKLSGDDDDELLNSRALQITNYLTAALRLSRPQSDSLRAETGRQLRRLAAAADAAADAAPEVAASRPLPALSSGPQARPYHEALRRILSEAQYQQLLALETRQGGQQVVGLIATLR